MAGIAMAASVAIAGCAGNGQGLDANGQPLVPGGGGNQPLTADFDSIQAHVFTPICTACHAGATAPHGLRLDAADSYNLLVGVPSDEVSGILRVKPGDPDNSYLIQKLEGHASVGARMPFGGPYLAADVIAVMRQWITNGASRSPTSPAAAPTSFAVITVAPGVDETLAVAPPQIMVGFNQDVDQTRLTSGSVRLERVAQDSAGSLTEIVPTRLTVPTANPRTVLLWPLQTLQPGYYRVMLQATDEAEVVVSSFDIEASR